MVSFAGQILGNLFYPLYTHNENKYLFLIKKFQKQCQAILQKYKIKKINKCNNLIKIIDMFILIYSIVSNFLLLLLINNAR